MPIPISEFPGSAHCSTSTLPAGIHSLTAAFASFNSNFTISRGTSGACTIAVTPEGGLTGNVSLTCSGAPTNGSCTISPSTVTLDGTDPASATVTATVNHNAGTGTRTLTFKGNNGTITHSTTVTLHIN